MGFGIKLLAEYWEFPKIGVVFRVLYWGPVFSETPV